MVKYMPKSIITLIHIFVSLFSSFLEDGSPQGYCEVLPRNVHRRFGRAYFSHHQGDKLMTKAVNMPETLPTSTRLHDAVSQKVAIFILAAVRTLSLLTRLFLSLFFFIFSIHCPSFGQINCWLSNWIFLKWGQILILWSQERATVTEGRLNVCVRKHETAMQTVTGEITAVILCHVDSYLHWTVALAMFQTGVQRLRQSVRHCACYRALWKNWFSVVSLLC
jgi:hypothetical protein